MADGARGAGDSRGRGRGGGGRGGGGGGARGGRAPKGESSPFEFLAILDFEATCEDGVRIDPQEIIEFPTVLINVREGRVVSEFQTYVKPVHHPALSRFCTDLTGITQAQVDAGRAFPDALAAWTEWMKSQGVDPERDVDKCVVVTCGDWDLKTMLPAQARLSDTPIPRLLRRWCNIKFAFGDAYGERPHGMTSMLEALHLDLKGKHHSGIDDCRNLARIAIAMSEARKGGYLDVTWHERRS